MWLSQDFKSLTSSDKSFYALVNQVNAAWLLVAVCKAQTCIGSCCKLQIMETIVGVAVINASVYKAGPVEDEVFKLDFR